MPDFNYQEPKQVVLPTETRIENVVGTLPFVTSAPSWVPKNFQQMMAIALISATYYLYVYDAINGTWRRTTLT